MNPEKEEGKEQRDRPEQSEKRVQKEKQEKEKRKNQEKRKVQWEEEWQVQGKRRGKKETSKVWQVQPSQPQPRYRLPQELADHIRSHDLQLESRPYTKYLINALNNHITFITRDINFIINCSNVHERVRA